MNAGLPLLALVAATTFSVEAIVPSAPGLQATPDPGPVAVAFEAVLGQISEARRGSATVWGTHFTEPSETGAPRAYAEESGSGVAERLGLPLVSAAHACAAEPGVSLLSAHVDLASGAGPQVRVLYTERATLGWRQETFLVQLRPLNGGWGAEEVVPRIAVHGRCD